MDFRPPFSELASTCRTLPRWPNSAADQQQPPVSAPLTATPEAHHVPAAPGPVWPRRGPEVRLMLLSASSGGRTRYQRADPMGHEEQALMPDHDDIPAPSACAGSGCHPSSRRSLASNPWGLDLNLPVELGVRDGRDAPVRWAVLLEDVILISRQPLTDRSPAAPSSRGRLASGETEHRLWKVMAGTAACFYLQWGDCALRAPQGCRCDKVTERGATRTLTAALVLLTTRYPAPRGNRGARTHGRAITRGDMMTRRRTYVECGRTGSVAGDEVRGWLAAAAQAPERKFSAFDQSCRLRTWPKSAGLMRSTSPSPAGSPSSPFPTEGSCRI